MYVKTAGICPPSPENALATATAAVVSKARVVTAEKPYYDNRSNDDDPCAATIVAGVVVVT